MPRTVFSGFCKMQPLIINGATSPLGELTNRTESYVKEQDFYWQTGKPAELIIFRGVAGSSQFEKIPTNFQTKVLDVCNWLYTQASNKKLTNSKANALQQLIANFTDGFTFKDIGEMVTNNQIWLPAWINFNLVVNSIEHEFKIWFSVSHFETEFPYRDIYVIGPVPPEEIDLLLTLNYKELQTRLSEENAGRIQDRVDKLIDGDKYPYTRRSIFSYDVYDQINKPFTTTAQWTVIIYGNPFNAEEAIEEAIRNCIITNTKKSESQWENGVPDLFNPKELLIIPHWNDNALINETLLGSTYSPIYHVQNGDYLANKYGDLYDTTVIKNNLEIVPFQWKSLKVSALGKPKNTNNQTTFKSLYGDYQLIPSMDSQAGMMSEDTSNMVLQIEDLFASAEKVTPDSVLPTSVQKVTRKDRLYVTMKIGKVKFICLSRYQLIKDGLIND